MTWRGALISLVATLAISIPLIAAGQSPLLQWRDPIYIISGFAGILGLGLLLVQPLLILGALPVASSRRMHIWAGSGLVFVVMVHVVGLWITSPPDVVDVLLLRSPAPFSYWGLLAFWALFIAAFLAAVRKRIGLRNWRLGHSIAVVAIVIGTVVHAWLIQGTMEVYTKRALCLMVLCVGAFALWKRRVWRLLI